MLYDIFCFRKKHGFNTNKILNFCGIGLFSDFVTKGLKYKLRFLRFRFIFEP
jgi:hypothetical protein